MTVLEQLVEQGCEIAEQGSSPDFLALKVLMDFVQKANKIKKLLGHKNELEFKAEEIRILAAKIRQKLDANGKLELEKQLHAIRKLPEIEEPDFPNSYEARRTLTGRHR